MSKVPSNMRLLLIVVQSVNEARRLVSLGDDLSYMRAVFSLDFAVEQMLNILIDNFAPNTTFDRDDVSWKHLWQAATTAVKDANVITDRIPHYRQLKKLHDIRNLSQHQGCTPHSSDVAQLVDPVVRMISTCFEQGFDLSFENFRLSDVIRNSQLRQLLEQCEQALDNGFPFESLVGAVVAFKHITSEIGKVRENDYRLPRLDSFRNISTASIGHPHNTWREVQSLEQWIANITTSLEQLHIDSILGSLGLSLTETQKFRRLTRVVSVTEMVSGDWRPGNNSRRRDDALKDPANFVLGYLSRLTLRAQEVYPEALDRVSLKKLLNDQEWMRDALS
jgi:hypothetical protein